MSAYTPGPWELRQSTRHGYWFIDYEQDAQGHTLTKLDCGEADARLLASAPELLNAVRFALRALNVAPRFKVPGAGDSYEVCSELERVLRKVEGAL
jgi:hypothetical protein